MDYEIQQRSIQAAQPTILQQINQTKAALEDQRKKVLSLEQTSSPQTVPLQAPATTVQ